MSVRSILEWPDPLLSRHCTPVTRPADAEALVADMFETMYAASGRGLAAPQIGETCRVFVMDVGWKTGPRTPMACVNPRILEASDRTAPGPEMCLSMPGVSVEVERFSTIVLGFADETGAMRTRQLVGAEAICAQHELDHLDGILHIDRVQEDRRARALADFKALT